MHLNESIIILSEKNEKIWYNLLLKLVFKVSIGIRKGFTQSLYYTGLRCQMPKIVARLSLLFFFCLLSGRSIFSWEYSFKREVTANLCERE